VLAKVAVVALVLVGSGTLVPGAAGGQVNGVVRLDCPAENDANVTERDVRIRRDGNVHFRIVLGFESELLYARRPKDIFKSHGRDFEHQPGTFYEELTLGRGRWLVGCFSGVFSTRDHPPEDYALIRVVR
jgi:hypothetical protein